MSIDTIKSSKKIRSVTMLILDGWGLSPSWGGNAIAMNNPPNITSFWRKYPHKILHAFRPIAGESKNVANSEIGHASISTGRMINQDITDINASIKNGSFYHNTVLFDAIYNTKENNSNLHLIGMISDGAVHSHINHLYALLKLAKTQNIKNVYIHAILDGRDVESNTAIKFIHDLEEKITKIGVGKIATLCGRYFAMDRNENWKQIETFYRSLILREGRQEKDPLPAISKLYREGFSDEFVPPIILSTDGKIKNKDSVIVFNYRADRVRQLTQAFCDKKVFSALFARKYPLLDINFTTMTNYKLPLPNVNIAFASAIIQSNISKILSDHGYKQLHAAESEKYAHVTYFFNGGQEEPYSGEDRLIVKSPKVASYNLKPEMSAYELTAKLVSNITSKKYQFIVANFANVDMVGHTGDILAASRAVEAVDKCVGKIANEVLKSDGVMIITADHGNAEQMLTLKTFSMDLETLHSLNPVPFILVDKTRQKNLFKNVSKPENFILSDILSSTNTLADVAPSILELFGIAKPTDMTGHSLLGELE